MVDKIKDKILQAVDIHNGQSLWEVKTFDISLFDVDYHKDIPIKNKLKESSISKNIISACFSTESCEKKVTIKELLNTVETLLGFNAIHVKILTTKHFYFYFEYNQDVIYDDRLRKKLISKIYQ
jgi:hypothetical protein